MAVMRVTRHLWGVAGALLVTFHGWLLASQFLDGQLAQPFLVLRWAVAAALVAALVLLRRQGAVVFSRKSMAVWVLAFLLHGPAVAGHYGAALQNAALAAESIAPVVLQIAAASTTLVLAHWLLGAPRGREAKGSARSADVAFGLRHAAAVPLARRCAPPFSPRPPPIA